MRTLLTALAGVIAGLFVLAPSASANNQVMRGKVVMEDGSPPNRSIGVERFCHDTGAQRESQTDKKGAYLWVMEIDPLSLRACVLRASLAGYDSTVIDVSSFNWSTDPNLPPLVLRRREAGSADESTNIFYQDGIPLAARTAWNNAGKLSEKKNWKAVERELRAAVQAAPKFTRGWYALGVACSRQNEPAEARDAFQHVVDLDPKSLDAYLPLARESIAAKDWSTAESAAARLIKADTKQRYPEIYLHQATARFYLKDLDGAESSARTGIRLDPRREVPRTEYVLGVILEAKQDYTGAREHMLQYLTLDSKAADAAEVRSRMENLGRPQAPSTEDAQEGIKDLQLELVAATPFAGAGEAWVPGGMKAMTAIVHLEEPVTYFGFFSNYCRAIVREASVGASSGAPQFIQSLRVYLAAVSEMAPLGERGDDGTRITLSLATDERRRQSERILRLLGWKLGQRDSSVTVEPGDQPEDSLRQAIPAALGIDEIRMQETLEAGREFQFEIPTENARLAGGEDWSALLKDVLVPPGGVAAVFATDWRLAKTCAGLGAMSDDAAAALLTTADLRTLATRYADPLARHGEAFTLSAGVVALPGGAEAAPAWQKLAGENPRKPGPFFRALLDQQFGTLAAFYSVLSRSDAAHQRFFTKTVARAERFYAWYRQGDEFRNGQARQVEGWRTEFLQKLPLDGAGNARFPGGKAAWTASTAQDDDVLLGLPTLETLVPIAELEQKRGKPLDEASVRLLAKHYSEWSSLFPYFTRLRELGAQEFAALERFAGGVGASPAATQNAVLGEWHSLVELISLGVQAGSISQTAGSAAFRRVCLDLVTSDRIVPDHSARALAVLREIAGPGDLHEAVAGNLLRLGEERRASFERVLQLQNVPSLSDEKSSAATSLSGLVYAASLDPDGLLINADSRLLSKHQFVAPQDRDRDRDKDKDPKRLSIFSPAALVPAPSGAFLTGGLVNLADLGKGFAPAGRSVARSAPRVSESGPVSGGQGSVTPALTDLPPIEADFKTTGRLVEVYATVTDSRGRYVDNLTRDDFMVLDQRSPQNITAFEPQSNEVSVVLLLDTTGSMQFALPALKNAALRLISELRPEDSVAVYNFSESVTELQPFTTDKAAAKRAVLRTQAFGDTALYDALARVGQDLTGHAGKKVIVLFTDGKDNSSTLNPDTAIQRAKANGVPIYTIAQGEAIGHRDLLEQLAGISKATGGESFAIEKPSEIGRVFDKVSEDLTHGYLLSFQPPAAENPSYRPIQVVVGGRGLKVRAREGYYPE
jgi:Ca-activated chloride channel family protein